MPSHNKAAIGHIPEMPEGAGAVRQLRSSHEFETRWLLYRHIADADRDLKGRLPSDAPERLISVMLLAPGSLAFVLALSWGKMIKMPSWDAAEGELEASRQP
jgi:hypothetical protein